MANFNDESIGNTARMLMSNGMWNNKLLVVVSDSGGPSGTDDNVVNTVISKEVYMWYLLCLVVL